MRGKDDAVNLLRLDVRITPAYAGKSILSGKLHLGKEDHPRVCGEKPQYSQIIQPYMGSPPRMRGKACIPALFEPALGITPAYAGKSYEKAACESYV